MKLEEYVHCVEQEIKDRAALIESLEEAEVFYDAQYGEAKIVANVSPASSDASVPKATRPDTLTRFRVP